MTKETLHLYRDDGGNVYAARNLDHAKQLLMTDTDYDPDVEDVEWESIPDDVEITIRDDDDADGPVKKRAGDWANEAFAPGCIGGDNY